MFFLSYTEAMNKLYSKPVIKIKTVKTERHKPTSLHEIVRYILETNLTNSH